MKNTTTIEDMTESLVQFYETAGFEDVYNEKLKDKSDSEIKALYTQVIGG